MFFPLLVFYFLPGKIFPVTRFLVTALLVTRYCITRFSNTHSRRRKRKRKRKNKKSKKRKRHYSSSFSSDESVRSNLYQEMPLHSPYLPLNTAHVNAGLRFQNTYTYTQPCNFTNMYTPFPVSRSLAYQAPIRSHYPERHYAFGEKKRLMKKC